MERVSAVELELPNMDDLDEEQRKGVKRLLEAWPQGEELCEELAPHVSTRRGFAVLHHPLVIMVPYEPVIMAGRANLQYREKLKALARAEDARDWLTYMYLHERPYRVDAVLRTRLRLLEDGADVYWRVVRALWIDTENMREWVGVVEILLDGPDGDMMDEDERAALAAMEDPVRVFRGYLGRAQDWRGWSWTVDQKRAEWFGRRFASLHGKQARVVEATAPKASVVAYLTGRGEAEVVVSPKDVSVVRRYAVEEGTVHEDWGQVEVEVEVKE